MMKGQFKFSIDTIKTALFFQKFQFVIIGAGQILKSHQQNCFISALNCFGKTLPRYNRDSANFQVTSSKLPYFCKKFNS